MSRLFCPESLTLLESSLGPSPSVPQTQSYSLSPPGLSPTSSTREDCPYESSDHQIIRSSDILTLNMAMSRRLYMYTHEHRAIRVLSSANDSSQLFIGALSLPNH